MGELSFEYINSILKSVVGLTACPLDSFLIVVYLPLCLSGTASTSVSYCSTKHQSTKKKMFQPQRGKKKSEIKRKKRKTYEPYLGFHSKQILYPTCKILPKKRAMVQTIIKELKNLRRIRCRFLGPLDRAVIKLVRV